ncbi:MAG TPA: response regulator [Oligoflexus sp.]|uniref:response regulator n=1 Tax=Oligoflexus sp. TaxID=1971216 RepID=UPI002D373945|nr:response regulator [Oligoflexus sp.]HYX39635.1 response regulator [Oligoflexus sp.]
MFIEKPYKIALIDDDPLILSLMNQAISRDKDVLPLAFQNPKEALVEIKNQKIRLVFLDINMPQMFGDDVLRECMKLKLGIQVYVVTGNGTMIISDRCFSLGARAILPKPLNIDDFRASVREGIDYLDRWNDHMGRSTARKPA